MSTSYYVACSTCKECYLIGQNGWEFFTFYSGEEKCMVGLRVFLGKHVLCDSSTVSVLPENRVEDYKEISWPKINQ